MIINADKDKLQYDKIIQVMGEFRILLRQYFYTPEIINNIISLLSSMFETFSMDFFEESLTLQLKLKKTSIKKISEYTHTPEYYYYRTIDMFRNLFGSNISTIYAIVQKQDYEPEKKRYMINQVPALITVFIRLIYNIETISDNIINIKL